MNNFKGIRRVFLRIIVLFVGLVIGFGYLALSYHQTLSRINEHNEILFLNTKEKLLETFIHFQDFLFLTEERLLNSIDKPEIIISILLYRIELLMEKNFPEVVSLTFIPASNPRIAYTRSGKKLFNIVEEASQMQETQDLSITSLGKGEFKIRKPLYDKSKEVFGLLDSTFSVAYILYREFSENEILILEKKETILSTKQLFFNIPDVPYIFVLNQGSPSFWDFLIEFKYQIIVALVFGILLLYLGIFEGGIFSKRLIAKLRARVKERDKKIKILESEKETLSAQLIMTQNLLKLKNDSEQVKNILLYSVQERYRQMASRASVINNVVSEFILRQYSQDSHMQEVDNILQESNEFLIQLSNNYLMKEQDEIVDIYNSIVSIKQMFLSEIAENNITFEIRRRIKIRVSADPLVLNVILYNIFRIIIHRLSKNNYCKVMFEENEAFEILFQDNGYAIEDKIYLVKDNFTPDNILCLDKISLGKFIRYLGWEITFESGGKLQNSIKLLMPRYVEKSSSSNIIPLFKPKPYV